MIVYLLTGSFYEDIEIIGVYASREGAEVAKEESEKNPINCNYVFEITAGELQP